MHSLTLIRRNLSTAAFVLTAFALVFTFAGRAHARGGEANTFEIRVAGLDHPVKVIRDADGIPHIYAKTEHDLVFAQGWMQAEDRLFQMDFSRRFAAGTVAELLGPDAIPSDVQIRTLGILRGAQASEAAISPELRSAFEAFAAGVNAWVAERPLPPEYAALEITRFEPWKPIDTLAVGKALAFSLSFDLDIGTTESLLTYQGVAQAACVPGSPVCFDGTALFFEDLFRSAPFDPTTTVPESTQRPPLAARGKQKYRHPGVPMRARQRLKRWLEEAKKNPMLGAALNRREVDAGSNEWVVSGRLTKSGRPIQANDPHLALDSPATFLPAGLHGAGFDVVGQSVPGAPFIIQGQNRNISWGSTVNPLDVTDVFEESIVSDPRSPSGLSIVHVSPNPALDFLIPVPEVFRANTVGDGIPDNVVTLPPGGPIPAATLIVPRRNDGPIISLELDPATGTGTAFSVAYVGSAGTREFDAFRQVNLADDLDQFIAALQFFDVGSQNFSYADRAGNIAYVTSAEAPLREDLEAGTVVGAPPYFIRNGTGGNDWIPDPNPGPTQALPYKILPFAEMPRTINPRRGFVVNANNDPLGLTLDNDPLNTLRETGGIYYLSPGYADGLRVSRITRRLEALFKRGKVDVTDMQSVQADVVLGDAEVFVPYIKRAFRRAKAGGAPPMLAELAADGRVRKAVRRLRRWDFSAPTGLTEGYDESDIAGHRFLPSREEIDNSVAATIYSVWRGQFIRRVIDGTMANVAAAVGLPSLPTPGSSQAMSAVRNLVENFDTRGGVGASGIDFFAVPGLDDPQDRLAYVILRSLTDGLDRLAGEPFAPAFDYSTHQDDYRWGRLHRVVFDSPLGDPFNLPSATAGFPPPLSDLPGYPVDGGFSVVDASSHSARAQDADDFMFSAGPNRRYVGVMGKRRIRGFSALPGGVSGVLGEPLYGNLLKRYLTNDSYPVRNVYRHIQRGAIERLELTPYPRKK